MRKQIIIAGPTASGKTTLSLQIAYVLDAEIISVDSRQCYKFLDIGTAKPSAEELKLIRHHNISVLNPDESDSVSDFKKRVDEYVSDIESRGKRVIFCGGSTLHLQSLIRPLDDIPESNEENILQLTNLADIEGIDSLFEELKRVDPEYAEKMDGQNRQRIIRALDVWKQTGKPFSSFHSDEPFELPPNMTLFELHHPRKELHNRISARTEKMIESGLVEEVKAILNLGFDKNMQSLQTVGYREAIHFLEGKITRQEMIEKVKTSTRRYAKRQITWLRRWPFKTQLDMGRLTGDEAIKKVLASLK